MPKKNSLKHYRTGQYYHLYNRGANQQNIFLESADYDYFLSLFQRHLDDRPSTDQSGRHFHKYDTEVEMVAFCLLSNHFHLLCYLKEPAGIVHLMRSVMTAYTMYFNRKYSRSGKLYESAFLAAPIETETYLWHVSRYIHLKPLDINQNFKLYPYSSLTYFAGPARASWLHQERLIQTSADRQEYVDFVADETTMRQDMKYLKNILAA
jgi:putative transposase